MNVHPACYGYPLVSVDTMRMDEDDEEEWICDRCKWNAQDHKCVLCPVTTGAMKRTTDWKWAHLSCALWIPEVFFRFADGREPIDYLQLLPLKERWNRQCIHCKQEDGLCITCSHAGCKKIFHVTCGMKKNVYLEYKQSSSGADVIVSYCKTHAKNWHSKRHQKSFRIVRTHQTQDG